MISGIQVINIGLPNESVGSDSLFSAFTKANTNFTILFSNASPYNTFTGNTGISVANNASAGTLDITNTGVVNIIAGDNIVIDSSNGNVTISSTGSGNGAGITSVGLLPGANRLVVTGSPLVTSGNISIDLATIPNLIPGTYTYPTLTVDSYGRVANIASAASAGTVTYVGVTPGAGIQVTGSPVTSSGNINIINTGVTRINAGTGISVSGGNGNVTINATQLSGVTSVAVTSSTSLVITGSPISSSGTITVDLPNDLVIAGNITGGNLLTTGRVSFNGGEDLANLAAVSLATTASYFTTAAAETATLAAGVSGQIKTFMANSISAGNMVITVTNAGWKASGAGTMTFGTIGAGCTLQYMSSKWFCVGNNGAVFA